MGGDGHSGISPALKALTFSPALCPLEPPSLVLDGSEELTLPGMANGSIGYEQSPQSHLGVADHNLMMETGTRSSPALDSPDLMSVASNMVVDFTLPRMGSNGSACSTPRSSPARDRAAVRWTFREASCSDDEDQQMCILDDADMGTSVAAESPNSVAWVHSHEHPTISPMLASAMKPDSFIRSSSLTSLDSGG